MMGGLPNAGHNVAEKREEHYKKEEALEPCADFELLFEELDEFALLVNDFEHLHQSEVLILASTAIF